MWAGMVYVIGHLRQRVESDDDVSTSSERQRYVEDLGVLATRALRDGCEDLIADAQKFGPETSAQYWREVKATLGDPAHGPLQWGGDELMNGLKREALRLFSS